MQYSHNTEVNLTLFIVALICIKDSYTESRYKLSLPTELLIIKLLSSFKRGGHLPHLDQPLRFVQRMEESWLNSYMVSGVLSVGHS